MKNDKIFGLGQSVKGLLEVASKEESIYNTNCIHITPDGHAEATNGHVLMRIPLNELDPNDIPADLNITPLKESITITVQALRKALANKGKDGHIDILNYIFVSQNDGVVSLTSTDLDQVSEIKEKDDGREFPGTEQLWPKDDPVFSISFSADELEHVVKAVKQMQSYRGGAPIKFEFWDKDSGARVTFDVGDGQKGKGIIMPMKYDG